MDSGLPPERQPFISRVRSSKGYALARWLIAMCAVLLVLSTILALVVLLMISPCFKLPFTVMSLFEIGLDVPNSVVYVILSKPLPTGIFRSPMEVCGRAPIIDITVLPAFDFIKVAATGLALRVDSCDTQPDLDHTVKLVISGSKAVSNVSISDGLAISLTHTSQDGKYFQIAATNGTITSPTLARFKVDFPHDALISFDPPVGALYANYLEIFANELTLRGSSSEYNSCGDPAVGMKLTSGIFSKLLEAVVFFAQQGLPASSSSIGLTQFFFLKAVTTHQIEASTNPVSVRFEATADVNDDKSSVFSLTESDVQIEKSDCRLENLTLNLDSSDLRLKSWLTLNLSLVSSHVKGRARPLRNESDLKVLKESPALSPTSSPVDIKLGKSHFNLNFDVDVHFTRGKLRQKKQTVTPPQQSHQPGSFRMRHVQAIQYRNNGNNSTLSAASLAGKLETIKIRSLQALEPAPESAVMKLIFKVDFTLFGLHARQMRVHFGTTAGSLQLYRIGRVTNAMKVAFSFVDKSAPQGLVAQAVVASPLLKSSPPSLLDHETPDLLAAVLYPPAGMELGLWEMTVLDIRAAAFLPAKSRFRIDRLALKLDPSEKSVDDQSDAYEADDDYAYYYTQL